MTTPTEAEAKENETRIKHLLYYGNYKGEFLGNKSGHLDYFFEQMFLMAEQSLRFDTLRAKELFWYRLSLLSTIPISINREGLREKFYHSLESIHSATPKIIFDWFLPHLKDSELQKENEDRAYQFKQREDIFNRRLQEKCDEIDSLEQQVAELTAHLNTQGWISIEERLPEARKSVLLCEKDGTVFQGFKDNSDPESNMYLDETSTDRDGDNRDTFDVTRWMPLPTAPTNK